jgi:hypothetical protein
VTLMSHAILRDMEMSKEIQESIMLTSDREKEDSKTVPLNYLNTKLRNILIDTQICKINLVEAVNTLKPWPPKTILIMVSP